MTSRDSSLRLIQPAKSSQMTAIYRIILYNIFDNCKHDIRNAVALSASTIYACSRQERFLLDKDTGNIITTLAQGYKCTRFTLSEPYLLGSNMDLYDLSDVDNCLRSQILHT